MNPTSQNKTVEQGVAVFHCQHRSCDDIVWNLNNRRTNNVTNTPLSSGGFNSSLTIETQLNSSGSTVQCICVFFRNTPSELSAPAILLVQGKCMCMSTDLPCILEQDFVIISLCYQYFTIGIPEEVKNPMHQRDYSSKAITTEWNALSSLDLTDINPDIMYSVELFMITCGQHVPMGHQDVTGNSTTDGGLDLMQIYEISISARNNVPHAKNGTSAKIKGTY